jgi:hypothetical protein
MQQCKKAGAVSVSSPGNVKPHWRSKPSGGIDAGKAITALTTRGL